MTLKKQEAKGKENKQPAETAPQEAPVPEVASSGGAMTAVDGGVSVFITHPLIVAQCEDAEWDTYTSLSASNGAHMTRDKDSLGDVIQFQVFLQRPVWKMSANSDDEESNQYFRSSNLGPEDLADAKQEAIDAGYERASIKTGIELFILVTKCDKAPKYVGKQFTMNLAPTSVRNWKPLPGELQLAAAMQQLETKEFMPGYPAVTFQSTAKPASWKGKNYTVFEFEVV